ncbi:hypothetical protein SLA2020_266090 [Shorea laevis]
MEDFRAVLEECQFSDLGFTGSNSLGVIIEKTHPLRRKDWTVLLLILPGAINSRCGRFCVANSNSITAHFYSPMGPAEWRILTEETTSSLRPAGWSMSVHKVIEDSWAGSHGIGDPLEILAGKLEHCKRALMKWSKFRAGKEGGYGSKANREDCGASRSGHSCSVGELNIIRLPLTKTRQRGTQVEAKSQGSLAPARR